MTLLQSIGDFLFKMLPVILGSGGIAAIISSIFYHKENKTIKVEDVKQSEEETRAKELQNGHSYADLLEKMSQMLTYQADKQIEFQKDSNAGIQTDLIAIQNTVKDVAADVKEVKEKQALIEMYLDGPYHKWLDEYNLRSFSHIED